MTDLKEIQVQPKGFIKKLRDGDFGLAKTYWLFGVLAGIVANIIGGLIESLLILLIFTALQIVYMIFFYQGVWNAANKYEGKVIWAILAKIAVVIGVITIIVSFVRLISAF